MPVNAPTRAAVMTASRHSIDTSIVRSCGSDSRPHLNPVSHQCLSGPRPKTFWPWRYRVQDINSSSLSLAQSKKRLCDGFGSLARCPTVASRIEYTNDEEPMVRLYTPISQPVSSPYWPFHSSIIQVLRSEERRAGPVGR